MGKQIFSFCIYGSNPKYCEGMVRNLKHITEHYPSFETWIDIGANVPATYQALYESFPRTRLIKHDAADGRLMTYRFFHIDNPEVELMLVRDADSRIGKRDAWCIDQFIAQTDKTIFTIRDHMYHTRPIMGGQWGIRKIGGLNMRQAYQQYCAQYGESSAYQCDQNFLATAIYLPYRANILVFTSSIALPGEDARPIGVPRESIYDFCGNVILFDANGAEYPEFSIHGKVA